MKLFASNCVIYVKLVNSLTTIIFIINPPKQMEDLLRQLGGNGTAPDLRL
jgi:hypothetical protein